MSGVQTSRVRKFIAYLELKSPGIKSYRFKSPEINSLGFKSSFFAWSSIVWGSLVQRPKVFSLLGVLKFGGQMSGFKSESSNVWGSKVPKSLESMNLLSGTPFFGNLATALKCERMNGPSR